MIDFQFSKQTDALWNRRGCHRTVLCAVVFAIGLLGQNVSIEASPTRLTEIWLNQFGSKSLSSPATNPQGNTCAVGGKSEQPHPAVVRVIVPEEGAISYGSGTLVDLRGKFGLVITNWHVVRDSQGVVEVLFPDGFRSRARALKVDADWDLAALVIWRPLVEPVSIAPMAPHPGERLTICGYGQGTYRAATGRCTQYYAPRLDFPRHMVELDVEARQGDSGGPIFNQQGELSGVLFGAGQGTTLGSFGGRVESFLATLAPDIGQTPDNRQATDEALVQGKCPEPREPRPATLAAADSSVQTVAHDTPPPKPTQQQTASFWTAPSDVSAEGASQQSIASGAKPNWFEQMKSVLAAIGVVALAMQVLRVVR